MLETEHWPISEVSDSNVYQVSDKAITRIKNFIESFCSVDPRKTKEPKHRSFLDWYDEAIRSTNGVTVGSFIEWLLRPEPAGFRLEWTEGGSAHTADYSTQSEAKAAKARLKKMGGVEAQMTALMA